MTHNKPNKEDLYVYREGVRKLPALQREKWDSLTKSLVWEAICDFADEGGENSNVENFVTASMKQVHLHLFQKPMREFRPAYSFNDWGNQCVIDSRYRGFYSRCSPKERLAFVEMFALGDNTPEMVDCVCERLNAVFKERNVAYRLIRGLITDIDSEEERATVEEAGQKSEHIVKAARFLYDRDVPDCKNSVKESILAVEEISKGIVGKSGATLGQCLRALEKELPARHFLWQGMEKLYAYSNKVGGVRHAQKPGEADRAENEVSPAEARFILVTCSAICNYLRTKQAK